MDNSRETSIGDALKAQEARGRELLDSGAKRLGWKAGFGTAAAIEKLGTDGPLVGFLTDSSLVPSGVAIDVAERPTKLLADVRIDVFADGKPHALAADPAAVLGDLIDVVAGLANLLSESEDGLRTGDTIITGAAIKPFELSGGEAIEVRVGASTVAAKIA